MPYITKGFFINQYRINMIYEWQACWIFMKLNTLMKSGPLIVLIVSCQNYTAMDYIHSCTALFPRYIPVLMAQAKIYWNRENYSMVEKIFRKSVEFCNDHDTWKLNVAHVLFMQENKYKEAIGFYEPIVKKHYDKVRDQLTMKHLPECIFEKLEVVINSM